MLPTPIVSAAWLAAHPDLPVRFVDARHGADADAAYADGHIRGAVRAHLERDLSAPVVDAAVGGRHPLPSLEDWCATLGRWGVAPGVPVVVYDGGNGALAAARAWWMIAAVGHEAVAVLDGGLPAALEAGLPVDAVPVALAGVGAYPATGWRKPTVTMSEVESAPGQGRALLDVRAAERWRGEVELFDPVAGHIPGSRNAPLTDSLDARGRFLPAGELRARFEAVLDGAAIDTTIVSCGSGVTACHTLLAMEAAGMPGAALYVGSWSEWCRR